MKCNDCPYFDNSQICHIKCAYKKEKSKKVKLPTRIKQVSEKRKLQDIEYKKLRLEFLSKPENQICPITGQQATEVHHKRKRRGYADNWARENKISLYLDTRFWLGVSRDGHDWIENNPEEAYKLGYSIKNNQK